MTKKEKRREYMKEWRKKNPDYQKKWRAENPTYACLMQPKYRKTTKDENNDCDG